MSSIETKYGFGAEEGKYELIKTTFSYGFIGILAGILVRTGIHLFRSNPGVAASASKMTYD